MVEEHSVCSEAVIARYCGAYRRENVDISNRNADENSAHRKPKVSRATIFGPGLGNPKPRLCRVGDGRAG